MTDTTPPRGKTTTKSTSTSFAPQTHTPGDLTLVPDTKPAPTRNLIQLSTDLGVNKRRAVGRSDTPPTEQELHQRHDVKTVLSDLEYDLGVLQNGSARRLIARYGRVVGVEADDADGGKKPLGIIGWRFQKNYGMLVPSLNTSVGREWFDRINDLGVLGQNVDANPGACGGFGAASYHVFPID